MGTNNFNKPRITDGFDPNFYQKVDVNWATFGGQTDGNSPDIIITFPAQSVILLNEATTSSQVVEYSFNGQTVHGELDPSLPSRGLSFDNRVISKIWFRVKSGSAGPITVRVDSWSTR